jgi:hypothetical protein
MKIKLIFLAILIITISVFTPIKVYTENEFEGFKTETDLKQNEKLITVFYTKTYCVTCFIEVFEALRYLDMKKIINNNDKKNKLLFIIITDRKKIFKQIMEELKFTGYYLQGSPLMQRNLGIRTDEFLVVFDFEGKILYRYKSNEPITTDLVKLLKE